MCVCVCVRVCLARTTKHQIIILFHYRTIKETNVKHPSYAWPNVNPRCLTMSVNATEPP